MSLACPHFPNRASSSLCQPTCDLGPRSSRHIPLSTPWLHQGCDCPQLSREQWPAPPSSGPTAVPCRRKSVWYDPLLTQSPAAEKCRKDTLSPQDAPRRNHTADRAVFSRRVHPIQLLTSLPGQVTREQERRWTVGHRDSTPRPDFHFLGSPEATALNATCPRLIVHTSWRLL